MGGFRNYATYLNLILDKCTNVNKMPFHLLTRAKINDKVSLTRKKEEIFLQKINFDIKENSIQNAEFFLSKRSGRTTPNERVSDEHYLDIAIRGAKQLNENQNEQAKK